jgi:riboflavin kinase/FMN adenylyltransferase
VRIIREQAGWPAELTHGAVAIGNFDGVHRGHARIVAELLAQAQRVGGPAVVFTFDPHPVRLLRPDAVPPPLTWTERKAELLEALGVNFMVAYPTDDALLALTPRQFFDDMIRGQLAARAIVEGPNFCFGKGREGDVRFLATLCAEAGIGLTVVEPVQVGDGSISSSRVRELVQRGEVAEAGSLMTQPYRIRGIVTHGAARGARLGFPTANISGVDTLLPAPGVYAGRACVDGAVWPAAMNIGANPTFGEMNSKVEVHLIGFAGALYGQLLEVDFLHRLRDIRPFASVEELKQQLARDVEAARAHQPQGAGPGLKRVPSSDRG